VRKAVHIAPGTLEGGEHFGQGDAHGAVVGLIVSSHSHELQVKGGEQQVFKNSEQTTYLLVNPK